MLYWGFRMCLVRNGPELPTSPTLVNPWPVNIRLRFFHFSPCEIRIPSPSHGFRNPYPKFLRLYSLFFKRASAPSQIYRLYNLITWIINDLPASQMKMNAVKPRKTLKIGSFGYRFFISCNNRNSHTRCSPFYRILKCAPLAHNDH